MELFTLLDYITKIYPPFAGVLVLLYLLNFIWQRMPVTFTFIVNELDHLPYKAHVTVKRMDAQAAILTNIVSRDFYGGGRLPDAVRAAIISFTLPAYRTKSDRPL